jgi:hypothetical protein
MGSLFEVFELTQTQTRTPTHSHTHTFCGALRLQIIFINYPKFASYIFLDFYRMRGGEEKDNIK